MENGFLSQKYVQGILTAVGILLIIFLALVIITKSYDTYQVITKTPYPNDSINVSGEGKTTAMPDSVFLSFDLQEEGSSAKKVEEAYTKKIKDFTQSIVALGIPAGNISTASFSTSKDEEKSDTQFKADFTLKIKLEDPQRMSTHIAKIHEFATVHTMTATGTECPGFKNVHAHVSDARMNAVADANMKARDLSAAAGLTLGSLVSVSENISNSAGYSCPTPTSSIPIQPQEITVSISSTYEVR